MNTNTDLIIAKQAELAQMLRAACSRIGDPIQHAKATEIIHNFASITPPQHSNTPATLAMITMCPGGKDGAESIKAGNIILNISRLVTALANGVLTVVGVVQIPWTAVLGALVIWDTLHSTAKVDLSERDASVMWALWLRKDEDHTVPDMGLLRAVNAERKKHGRHLLKSVELKDALRKLERIHAIQRASKNPRHWWLREWVSVSFQ